MKDFLYLCLIKPFTCGDYMMCFLGLIMWICFSIIGCLILWGMVNLIDSVCMPRYDGKGKIIYKSMIPAHTTTTLIKVGNSMIPIMTKHDDEYYIDVEIDGRKDDVCVNKKYYRQVQIGDLVRCKYNLGRLFGKSLYIKQIG